MLNKEVSQRISMLRPLLIFGVIYIHLAGVNDDLAKHDGAFEHFAGFFQNTIFRASVPTMALIAGFLLFGANLDLTPKKMFKKKFATLAIPFLVFNLSYLAVVAILRFGFNKTFSFDVATYSGADWANAALGWRDYPINTPLHFIRDLLVTIALVPALSWFLRSKPWIGLGLLLAVFGTNLDGYLIIRDSSLVLFYVGGMMAVYKWDVLSLDKYAPVAAVLLVALCLTFSIFKISNIQPLVWAIPFLVWPAASLLRNTRLEKVALKYSKYSFFWFVAHWPLSAAIWWGVKNAGDAIPFPVYWFLTPFLIVSLLLAAYHFAMWAAPSAFSIAIGARRAKAADTPSGAQIPDVTALPGQVLDRGGK